MENPKRCHCLWIPARRLSDFGQAFLFCVNFCLTMKGDKMTKRQKLTLSIVTALSIVFGIVPTASAMHIMEGYLPAMHSLVWGVICVPFVVWGFISIKKTLSENRKSNYRSGYGWSIHLCYIITEDSFRYRKLFSHDRYRTGRHSLWACFCQHPWNYRIAIPGNPPCSRRTDHFGSKHLFHGHCRTICFLRCV